MKPKTALQKEVASLMHKVNGLTPKQIEWMEKRCFTPKAYSCRGEAWCSDCGQSFECREAEKSSIVCSHCGKRLEVEARIRRTDFYEENGFNIVTTCRGWQVIRCLEVCKRIKKGKKAEYGWCDILQNWIHPSGKDVIVAKMIAGMGWNRRYAWWSETEIRQGSARENGYTRILNFSLQYPRMSYIPEILRNGYDRKTCRKWAMFDVFTTLLSNPRAETLLKAGQTSAFQYSLMSPYSVDRKWQQIKICLRNGYVIEDFSLWKDYIDFLEYLGKDTHNAHYVCPKDLKKAHDVYMKKKRKKVAEEVRMKKLKEMAEAEDNYRKSKSRFFGIAIKVDDIDISVLKTVMDVYEEGEAMHHCVFDNGYYKKDDSVILSARRNGERVETVEYSLKQRKVVQCRGVCNKNTEYHDLIVDAVNRHSHLFRTAKVS